MRRFMYAAIGVLALTIAFGLGAHVGRANNTGLIIGMSGDWNNWHFVADEAGNLWSYDPQYHWQWWGLLPFPASQLRLFTASYAADTSGNLWWHDGSGHWTFIGPPPGSSAIGDNPQLAPSTWGAIKARGGK